MNLDKALEQIEMSLDKRLEQMVIIDLKATCGEPMPVWHDEIIQVGVCLLNLQSLEITKPCQILVKPERAPITGFCTALTGITSGLVAREGITLAEAMRILEKEYRLNERTWGSWGVYKLETLEKDCEAKRITFPGRIQDHINLKRLLAVELGLLWEDELEDALARFRLSFTDLHPQGIDAVNIAQSNSLSRG
jgi:inhibitor of KinA sporulation pathway (predicted exonuclease)